MKSVHVVILLLVLLAGCSHESSRPVSQNPNVAGTGMKPVIDLDAVPLSAVSPAALCSEEKKAELKDEVFDRATTEHDSVHIDCSLMLTPEDVQSRGQITKRLLFDTSGVTMDCGGAIINGDPGTFNFIGLLTNNST